MKRVELPISKSLANRWLISRAMQGDDMQSIVSSAIFPSLPDDVRIMASALAKIQHFDECVVDVDNCGTAMRFLTAYAAIQVGKTITLTGCERMCTSRPIGTLAVVLRDLGADITYLGKPGYPPLRIVGQRLDLDKKVRMGDVESTQFISALLLIGAQVETSVRSPYIYMTRAVIDSEYYQTSPILNDEYDKTDHVIHKGSHFFEPDWSAAAFWYERVALGLESEAFFPGLSLHSLQGDRVVADYFTRLGVITQETPDGIHIYHDDSSSPQIVRHQTLLPHDISHALLIEDGRFDLTATPDLYPALFLTCYLLNVHPAWVLPENLRIKESDRIEAMQSNIDRLHASKVESVSFIAQTYHDHRIAMAFMAAGYAVDDTACIAKSYPAFTSQLR